MKPKRLFVMIQVAFKGLKKGRSARYYFSFLLYFSPLKLHFHVTIQNAVGYSSCQLCPDL